MFKASFCGCPFSSSEATWNNFEHTLINRNKQKQRSRWCILKQFFVSNLFFAVEEVGASRELSFAMQGSQVSCFLVAFESLQLESRGNSSISRGISCFFIFFHCILTSAEIQIFTLSFELWQWSSHVSRMCFHVETLDQIKAHFVFNLPNVQLKSSLFHRFTSKWRHPVLVQVNWAWSHKKAFWPKKMKLPDFAQHIFAVQQRSACWHSPCFGCQACLSQSLSWSWTGT